jgi:hypothetical protein
MKTPVNQFFEQWLALMEQAYLDLTKQEFRELENKICYEIAATRSRKKK